MSWSRLALTLAARAIVHPPTGIALLRVGWRVRRRDWLTQAPFIPLPDATYVRWRMHTAYGDSGFVPAADDVIRYARWATTGG